MLLEQLRSEAAAARTEVAGLRGDVSELRGVVETRAVEALTRHSEVTERIVRLETRDELRPRRITGEMLAAAGGEPERGVRTAEHHQAEIEIPIGRGALHIRGGWLALAIAVLLLVSALVAVASSRGADALRQILAPPPASAPSSAHR